MIEKNSITIGAIPIQKNPKTKFCKQKQLQLNLKKKRIKIQNL